MPVCLPFPLVYRRDNRIPRLNITPPYPRQPWLEKPLVAINPEIIESKGEYVMEEGCLSVPGVRDEVTRAESIRVRFTDGNFERVEMELSGMWARVFQHEYDHLQQKFFINRLSGVKRQLLKPKLSRIKRGDVQTRYPVVSSVDEGKR